MIKKIVITVIMVIPLAFPASVFAGSSESDSQASVEYSPTFESNDKRSGWPGSAHRADPKLPANFAPVPDTHEKVGIEEFVKAFKWEWSLGEVQNFGKEEDKQNVETEVRTTTSLHPANHLKIIFPRARPRGKGIQEVGVVKGRSVEEETSMEAVLASVLLEALQMGGNIIVPLNEGAARVLSASGWSASVGYTHVKISGGESGSGVGGVGFGYASGKSRHKHEPFARFGVLSVPNSIYAQMTPEGPKSVEKAEKQKEPEPEKKTQKKEDIRAEKENEMLKKRLEYMKQKVDYYKQKK